MQPSPATITALRFGFGLPLPDAAPTRRADMLAALAGPDAALAQHPGIGAAEALRLSLPYEAARLARRENDTPETRAALRRSVRAIDDRARVAAQAAIARMMDAPDGLRERLVVFWANHFTTARRTVQFRALPSALVDEAIRPHLTAPFADLLTAVVLHPGMLTYLDQQSSMGPTSELGRKRKRGLNENLARELLELHTLGVGAAYGQADVRGLAELLTGLTLDLARGAAAFDPRRAEPGAEVVLGRSYGGDPAELGAIRAVLADLAVRPETARHIARKIAVHFLADVPDPADIAALEGEWRQSGGDLGAVMAVLLDRPAAWGPPGAKVRPPLEFVVAGLRALGVPGAEVAVMEGRQFTALVLTPLAAMGQPWQRAPSPEGFPEAGADWITPQRLAARLTWAAEAPPRLVPTLPDPRDLVVRALGDVAGARLSWAVARAADRRDGVSLVLASPEFNRR